MVADVNALDATLGIHRGPFALDVALHLPPGRTVALLGPNGAGKSTVVGALAGLVPLDRGEVRVGDRVLTDTAAGIDLSPRERRVGVVFQRDFLFPHLTVAENVAFGAAPGIAEVWIERLDLGAFADRRPTEVSGGEAKRVALARTLAAEPDVLLLDEPFAGVDAAAVAALRQVLAEHLAGFEGPRLLVTHDPVDAYLLADEVRIIEDGRITMVGTPDDVRRRPTTRYAADLAGANYLSGTASAGVVTVGGRGLAIAEKGIAGPVTVVIPARAIALHTTHPEGTPRNVWLAPIERVEDLGERARVAVGGPVPLVAEVTAEGARTLAGLPEVWVSVKATEITVLD
jgi:molybdate transport system ATP-binding protein